MVAAVVDRDLDVHHRVARDHAGVQCLLHALVHGGDELPRDPAAHDLVDELVAAARVGLEPQPGSHRTGRSRRSASCGGPAPWRSCGSSRGRGCEGPRARPPRGARSCRRDSTTSMAVSPMPVSTVWCVSSSRRTVSDGSSSTIALSAVPSLSSSALVFATMDDRVERLRQRQRRERHIALCGQRVVGVRVGELGDHGDVTGGRAVDVRGVLAHHLEQVRRALLLAGARVHEIGVGRERAGHDLHER